MRQRRSVGFGAGSVLVRLGALASMGLLGTSVATAQAPPPLRTEAPPAAAPPSRPAASEVSDLTTRFKFSERYTTAESKPKPSDIGTYRLASKYVHRRVDEQAQGAPLREESTTQIIFTERPTVVNNSGMVTDTVRRYDTVKVSHNQEKKLPGPLPLEKLTIWYKVRPGPPLVMTLDDKRPLTDQDYDWVFEATFMPDLALILPGTPTRVSDRWRVPKEAMKALFGRTPSKSSAVYATLQDVRLSADGKKTIAVIAVAGKAQLPPREAEYLLNCQLLFSYDTPAGPKTDSVDVVGQITDLRLALTTTSAVPNSKSRLMRTLTNELSIERRELGANDTALVVPVTPPAPTQANSWLTYTDPDSRFTFRHPQEYQTDDMAGDEAGDEIVLQDAPSGRMAPSVIKLGLVPKRNTETDRKLRDPDYIFSQLKEIWQENDIQPILGPKGQLPEAEWEADRKVFRMTAALKTTDRTASRIFFNQYVVQFTRNETLLITSTTPQDPPLPFRNTVEEILKSFTLGEPKK